MTVYIQKHCIRCLELLPVSEFSKNKTQKDGLNYYCKLCAKIKSSQHKMINRKNNLSDIFNDKKVSIGEKENIEKLRVLKNSLKYELKQENKYVEELKRLVSEVEFKRERLYNKNYYGDHISYFREKSYKRSLREKRAVPKWLTSLHREEIKSIYQESFDKTNDPSDPEVYNVDHIVPLKGENVSGLHVPWNLRVITRTENIKKRNFLLEDIPK